MDRVDDDAPPRKADPPTPMGPLQNTGAGNREDSQMSQISRPGRPAGPARVSGFN
ncbi:hypothetical protein VTJ04DRAFT_8019 [Mycothermus thermophilus]|uniref:uncharacterized protein n=1 Tax=Humicola insolens TaxID=85995 RepID=UPI003743580C